MHEQPRAVKIQQHIVGRQVCGGDCKASVGLELAECRQCLSVAAHNLDAFELAEPCAASDLHQSHMSNILAQRHDMYSALQCACTCARLCAETAGLRAEPGGAHEVQGCGVDMCLAILRHSQFEMRYACGAWSGMPGMVRGFCAKSVLSRGGFGGDAWRAAAESARWKPDADASDLRLLARMDEAAAMPSAEDRDVWEAALVRKDDPEGQNSGAAALRLVGALRRCRASSPSASAPLCSDCMSTRPMRPA